MRSKSFFPTQLIGLLAISLVLAATACQQTPALPEYRKYNGPTDVPKISVEEAKKEVDAGTAIIVDSRGDAVYNSEHITGSINLPVGSAKGKFAALPKNKKVIIYCSCAGEGTSNHLAFQMNQEGIANTYSLTGGTQAWKNAGYPMTTGPVVVAQ